MIQSDCKALLIKVLKLKSVQSHHFRLNKSLQFKLVNRNHSKIPRPFIQPCSTKTSTKLSSAKLTWTSSLNNKSVPSRPRKSFSRPFRKVLRWNCTTLTLWTRKKNSSFPLSWMDLLPTFLTISCLQLKTHTNKLNSFKPGSTCSTPKNSINSKSLNQCFNKRSKA